MVALWTSLRGLQSIELQCVTSGIRGDILNVTTPLVGGCAALPFDRYTVEEADHERYSLIKLSIPTILESVSFLKKIQPYQYMLKISSSCIRGSSIVFHSFEAVDQCMLRSFSIASIVLAGCILLQKLQIKSSTNLFDPRMPSALIGDWTYPSLTAHTWGDFVNRTAAAGREELLASSIQIYGSAVWFCVNAAAAAESDAVSTSGGRTAA
nr:NADH-ubiquinone oxidoreductase chain 5 [Ipomoea batatas]